MKVRIRVDNLDILLGKQNWRILPKSVRLRLCKELVLNLFETQCNFFAGVMSKARLVLTFNQLFYVCRALDRGKT